MEFLFNTNIILGVRELRKCRIKNAECRMELKAERGNQGASVRSEEK